MRRVEPGGRAGCASARVLADRPAPLGEKALSRSERDASSSVASVSLNRLRNPNEAITATLAWRRRSDPAGGMRHAIAASRHPARHLRDGVAQLGVTTRKCFECTTILDEA